MNTLQAAQPSIQMTPNDLWIRKGWLCILIAETILGFIAIFLFPLDESIAKYIWIGLALQLFILFVGYHFSYKRHGTRWLLFWITATPASLNNQIRDLIADPSLINGIGLIFAGFFFVLSYMLWKINKKIQIQRVIASDAYQNAVLSLHSAADVKDLKLKFKTALRKRSLRFRSVLKQEYRKQLKQLSSC